MIRNDFTKGLLIIFLTVCSFLIINSCTNLSTSDSLRSTSWVKVETSYTDTSIVTSAEKLKDSTAYLRMYRGFNISWKRVDGAAYYEVKISENPITKNNWDKAVYAMRADDNGKPVISTSFDPKPEIMKNICTGCEVCIKACPLAAINKVNNKAVIDLNKCTGCGVCFDKCPYNAILNRVLGKYYQFAVRAFTRDNIPSSDITTSISKFKLYVNNWFEKCIRCTLGGCHPFYRNDCPVNALYDDPTGLIHIDLARCINCGKCVKRCTMVGPTGSLRRHVVEYGQKIIE